MSQNIYNEHEKQYEKYHIHDYAQYQSILQHDYHEIETKELFRIQNNQMKDF